MRRFCLPPVLIAMFLTGCTTVFNEPIETGVSNIAPSGVEYEVIFDREVVNAHSAVTAVLSTFKTSAEVKKKPEFSAVDIATCRDAVDKINLARKVIDETIPANGWENKKTDFLEVTSQMVETIKNGLDSGDINLELLSKHEVRLSSLSSSDSGASSLQGVELWHD